MGLKEDVQSFILPLKTHVLLGPVFHNSACAPPHLKCEHSERESLMDVIPCADPSPCLLSIATISIPLIILPGLIHASTIAHSRPGSPQLQTNNEPCANTRWARDHTLRETPWSQNSQFRLPQPLPRSHPRQTLTL